MTSVGTREDATALPAKNRVFHSVTTVRGLAALAVCWFHMGLWSDVLPPGVLRYSAGLGWLGPHIFFIVSGFVVPWSLYIVGYRWRDAHRYLARRIVRLDPPYFATIALVLALGYLGAKVGLREGGVDPDAVRVASHLAYLTGIVGERWYNPVFWTLAIEFQFYLALGLFFPFVASRRRAVRWAAMGFCLAVFVPLAGAAQTVWLTGYLPLFMLGFLLFQYNAGLIRKHELWLWALPLLAIAATFTYMLSLLAFAAFGLMLEDRFRNRISEFLGKISYSLYLIHMPVGIPVVRLTERFADGPGGHVAVSLTAMLFCVSASWVFYYAVERPSIRLARRISLQPGGGARMLWGLAGGSADDAPPQAVGYGIGRFPAARR